MAHQATPTQLDQTVEDFANAARIAVSAGFDALELHESALDEGFEFVAMARALLREPDLVNTMHTGTQRDGTCDHRNRCLPTIYSGTQCLLRKESGPA